MANCQSVFPACYELLISGVQLNRGLMIETLMAFCLTRGSEYLLLFEELNMDIQIPSQPLLCSSWASPLAVLRWQWGPSC